MSCYVLRPDINWNYCMRITLQLMDDVDVRLIQEYHVASVLIGK